MTKITFDCDRCGNSVTGLHTEHGTSGFYNVSSGTWAEYAEGDNEHFVCDECVQSMPLYIERYGVRLASTPEELAWKANADAPIGWPPSESTAHE